MQVVLADIEEDVLEKTVEELRQYQHRVIGIKTDVLIEESVQELFIKAKEEYGNIHILCNNAGIGANSGTKPIWEIGKKGLGLGDGRKLSRSSLWNTIIPASYDIAW